MNLESKKLPRDTVEGKSHLEMYQVFLHANISVIDGLGLRTKASFTRPLMAVS